jgi:ankyrin repeat protein
MSLLLPPEPLSSDADNKHITSVLTASRLGDKKRVLELLQESQCDVNESHEGSTPALIATYRGWEEVVRGLIRHGANFDVRTEMGETPLMRAIRSGKFSPEVIELMLDQGKAQHVINEQTSDKAFFSGWTALHFASDSTLNPHPEIITILLKHGADTSIKAKNGKTPLEVAAGNATYLGLLKTRHHGHSVSNSRETSTDGEHHKNTLANFAHNLLHPHGHSHNS